MKRIGVIFGSLVLAACTSASAPDEQEVPPGEEEATPNDYDAPDIRIERPERGLVTEGETVEVSGRVDDASEVTFTVNGTVIPVNPDGSFFATVDVEPGINVLRSQARDEAGNESTDTRSVAIGEFVDSRTPVEDAVAIDLSAGTLGTIAAKVDAELSKINIESALKAQNPVVSTGSGCNRASVDVETVSYSNITVSIVPRSGRLEVIGVIHDVDVRGEANYRLVCLGGAQAVGVSADEIRIDAELRLDTNSDEVRVVVNDEDISFVGLDADVGIIGLEQLLNAVDSIVANKIADRFEGNIGPAVEKQIRYLVDRTFTQSVGGIPVKYEMKPAWAQIDSQGVVLSGTTEVYVDGSGSSYLSSPASLPSPLRSGTSGAGVALADDVVDQILAVLWTEGLLSQSFPLDDLEFPLPGITRFEMEALLPPMATMRAATGARVNVGDMLVRLYAHPEGEPEQLVVELAVYASMGLAAETMGDQLQLATDLIDLEVDVTQTSAITDDFIDVRAIGVLAEIAAEAAVIELNGVLDGVRLPRIFGVAFGAPALTPTEGYAIFETSLSLD